MNNSSSSSSFAGLTAAAGIVVAAFLMCSHGTYCAAETERIECSSWNVSLALIACKLDVIFPDCCTRAASINPLCFCLYPDQILRLVWKESSCFPDHSSCPSSCRPIPARNTSTGCNEDCVGAFVNVRQCVADANIVFVA